MDYRAGQLGIEATDPTLATRYHRLMVSHNPTRYRVPDDLRAARRTSHTKRGRADDTRSRQTLRHRLVLQSTL